MKKILVLLVCVLGIVSVGGCSKKGEPVKSPTEEKIKPPPPVVVVDPHEGMALSPLTGEYVDEEVASLKPFAVVINNLHKALPQSGIGQADIYYEVLAEGEITRIVAIFQDFNAEKIGPVRSARDYFTYFALDNNAFFIHHGGSQTGYEAVGNRGLESLDGMVGTGFWRDKSRMNKAGMYEHSSYTDAESLKTAVSDKGFSTQRDPNERGMFAFYKKETQLSGDAITATNIKLPFSGYQESQFVYDDTTRLYKRLQSGNEQIDDQTGKTLTVKNVIIQQANTQVISGDEAGRREVELVGSGKGLFITNGKARNITWEKRSFNSPTVWYDEKGEMLKLNPGKTWVCVYPTNKEYSLE